MPPLSDFVVSRGNNTWQKHGQDQYALGNYTEALDAFTKAIHLGQGDLIAILDNRAAAYCKLGSLGSGLGDGRRMIKIDKKDPRGYLRTAKVLQLMKKMDEALQVYNYALKSLDSESQERQQIQTLRAKLDKAINGEKLVDPFMVLPVELISEVLCYLNLRTLLRVVRVSKPWLRLAVSLAKGFSHLDLSLARRAVPITPIRAYIQRTNKTLRRVSLANVKPDILPKIVTFLSRCHNVTDLDIDLEIDMKTHFAPLNTLTRLTTLATQPTFRMSSSQLVDILRRCRNLEKIEAYLRPHNKTIDLPALENLRSVTIGGFYMRSDPLVKLFHDKSIAELLPNLEELCFIGGQGFDQPLSGPPVASGFSRLRRYELITWQLEESPELPKSLENLSILFSSMDGNLVDEEHFKGLGKLKTAAFMGFNSVTVELLECLLTDAKPTLTGLDIEWTQIDGGELRDLMNAGLFENLTHLNIGRLLDVDDLVTDTIVDTMPNLKVLGLIETKVGPLGLKSLADTEKLKLRTLFVERMETPMDRDAIDYAKNKGIEIPPLQARGPRFRFCEL